MSGCILHPEAYVGCAGPDLPTRLHPLPPKTPVKLNVWIESCSISKLRHRQFPKRISPHSPQSTAALRTQTQDVRSRLRKPAIWSTNGSQSSNLPGSISRTLGDRRILLDELPRHVAKIYSVSARPHRDAGTFSATWFSGTGKTGDPKALPHTTSDLLSPRGEQSPDRGGPHLAWRTPSSRKPTPPTLTV